MSELTIRSGGVVEVDTGSLEDAAQGMRFVAADAADTAALLAAASDHAAGADFFVTAEIGSALVGCRRIAEDAAELAGALERAARLYESVELLTARTAALAEGDAALAARLAGEMRALLADDPSLLRQAAEAMSERRRSDDLEDQVFLATLAAGPAAALAARGLVSGLRRAVDDAGAGTVARSDRLRGPTPVVALRTVASTVPASAPASLAEAAARIPGGGDARVRVERYRAADGTAQFAVYVAGTQQGGDAEAFDLESNLQLYTGQRSASYEAVAAALAAAGAQPGDVVHAFAHSQGAMVTERLALEGGYRVETLVSFGAPVQADVGPETLAVSIRHTDDPVAVLQGGGSARQVGSADSFVVERSADPLPGTQDLALLAHHMSGYTETAALVDAATDPRVDALRRSFDRLASAEQVGAREYAVARVSPSASGAG